MPQEISAGDGSPPPRDIDALVTQLSALLADLLTMARGTADPVVLLQINNEYMAVKTVLDQAVNVQLATDDAVFAQATTGLKSQSKLLDGMQAQITSVVKDVALAGKMVGYVSQAVVLIAKL
jgi:hypothetical protein